MQSKVRVVIRLFFEINMSRLEPQDSPFGLLEAHGWNVYTREGVLGSNI